MRQLPPPIGCTASRGHILSVASTAVCAAVLTLSSCVDNGIVQPGQKEYEQNFVKEFGVPDKNHNWSMADGHMAHVNLPSGFNGHVRLYTSLPGSEDCRMLANIKVKDGKADEPFLVPCDISKVFVLISDCPDVYTYAGYKPLDGVAFNIDDSNDGGRAVSDIQELRYYYTLRDLYIAPSNGEHHDPKDEGIVECFEEGDQEHSLIQGTVRTMTQRELWNIVHPNTSEEWSQNPARPEVFPWGAWKKYGLAGGGLNEIEGTYYPPRRISLRSENETGAIPLEICVSTLHEHYYDNIKIGYFCYEEIARYVKNGDENVYSAISNPASVFAFFNQTRKYVVYDGRVEDLWHSVSYDQSMYDELKRQFDESYELNYPGNPKPIEPTLEDYPDEQIYNDKLAAYQEDLKHYEEQYQTDWNNYKKEHSNECQVNANVSYAKMEPDGEGKIYPSLQEVAEMTQEQADASDVTYQTLTINVPADGKHYGLFIIGDDREIVTSDLYFNSLLHRENADYYTGLIECADIQDENLDYYYLGFGLEYGHQNVGNNEYDAPSDANSDASGRDALDIVFRVPRGLYTITESLPYPVRPNMVARFIDWTIACEDLGGTDDFDFNDVVLNYNYNNGNPTLTLLAAGGTLDTKIYINGNEWGEVHELFGVPKGTMVNTGRYSVEDLPQTVLKKIDEYGNGDYFESEIKYEEGSIKDEYGNITGTEIVYYYIPRIQLSTIRDDNDGAALIYDSSKLVDKNYENIAPTAMILEGGWRWPVERCHIVDAYPSFKNWVSNQHYVNERPEMLPDITSGMDYWTESDDVKEVNLCPAPTITYPSSSEGSY